MAYSTTRVLTTSKVKRKCRRACRTSERQRHQQFEIRKTCGAGETEGALSYLNEQWLNKHKEKFVSVCADQTLLRSHVSKEALDLILKELLRLDDPEFDYSASSGKFMRRFRLPENAKMEEVKATMENGVLTVTVPKVEDKKKEVKAIDIAG
uniref:SHSP domain-containing protein n=1 Tax=Tanacetum cinerariifolium TaxID=118510 RepID=A0A6L2LSJ3_TANCI|nr:hypothetical protein [Tanacetum cinerariifolium]